MTTVGALTWSRRERLKAPAATIGALALLSVALRLRDPHHQGSWGLCPSAALGIACPGCGGLRAVNDLTRGHPLEALSSNALLITLLPFVVLALGVWTLDRYRGRSRELPAPLARGLLVGGVLVALSFTVLRNLPGSWLAP